jgi:hypothetical protein
MGPFHASINRQEAVNYNNEQITLLVAIHTLQADYNFKFAPVLYNEFQEFLAESIHLTSKVESVPFFLVDTLRQAFPEFDPLFDEKTDEEKQGIEKCDAFEVAIRYSEEQNMMEIETTKESFTYILPPIPNLYNLCIKELFADTLNREHFILQQGDDIKESDITEFSIAMATTEALLAVLDLNGDQVEVMATPWDIFMLFANVSRMVYDLASKICTEDYRRKVLEGEAIPFLINGIDPMEFTVDDMTHISCDNLTQTPYEYKRK